MTVKGIGVVNLGLELESFTLMIKTAQKYRKSSCKFTFQQLNN
jgi:hypothetical protein